MTEVPYLFPHYEKIRTHQKKAHYLNCKHIPVCFTTEQSTQTLWQEHNHVLHKPSIQKNQPDQNLLDLKVELAARIYRNCTFCERLCRVDRQHTTGACGVSSAKIASEFLHYGEEHILIPSHTIFFSGCTFQCVFCQNWDISQHHTGISVDPSTLSSIITTRKNQGAININWVGGDPTSNLYYILKVLQQCEENLAQIWNSNMYCSEQTMKLLHGVIDLYLTDFKYGNDACAQRLSKIPNYLQIIQRNHHLAAHQGDILIRHLVMPHHNNCCSQPIIRWIAKNLPKTAVNIMAQYRPEYKSKHYNELTCPLSQEQYLEVLTYAHHHQLHLL